MQRWDISAYIIQDLLEVEHNNMISDHCLKVTEQMKSEQHRITWTCSDKQPALEINLFLNSLRP